MSVSTERILEVYAETGCYDETAKRVGMKYDAVRKRVARYGTDPFPIIPGKSILYENPDPEDPMRLVWAKGGPKKGPSLEEAADAVRDALDDYKPPAPLKRLVRGNCDLAAFYPLPDLHMGLRCWGPEVGQDWDLDIANKRYRESLEMLVSQSPETDQAYVLGLGDLLHSDNYEYKTGTAGSSHVLDVDGRYPKVLKVATDLVVFAVDLAAQKAKSVEVRILPGNHDTHSSIAVALAVSYHFKKHKHITVNSDPAPYWAREWGRVMLGAAHGHKIKPRDMQGYMPGRFPEMWGRTKFRHFFFGHIHHETLKEHPGCTVETLASPAAADSYNDGMGYYSHQSLQSRIYHKERGEIMRQKVNL